MKYINCKNQLNRTDWIDQQSSELLQEYLRGEMTWGLSFNSISVNFTLGDETGTDGNGVITEFPV